MYFITQYNNKLTKTHGNFYVATPENVVWRSGNIPGVEYNFTNMQEFVRRAPDRYFFKLTILME